jgi:hypothetical protein
VHAAVDSLVVEPYRPALQLVQALAPTRLYCPSGQATAVALVEPAGQTDPAVQGPVHDDDARPDADPNRPASQGPLHAALSRAADPPYRPALQLVQVPAPARLYLPIGHADDVLLTDPAAQA